MLAGEPGSAQQLEHGDDDLPALGVEGLADDAPAKGQSAEPGEPGGPAG